MAIKPKHKEFIKNQVLMKNCSAYTIKKELDRLFPNETTPTRCSVSKWASFFKASITGNPMNSSSKTMLDEKYRNFIEKSVHDGKNGKTVIKELWETYGKTAASYSAIYAWYTRFKRAIESSAAKSSRKSNSQPASNSNDNIMGSGLSSSDVMVKVTPTIANESSKVKSEPGVLFVEDVSMNNRPTTSQNLEPEMILGDAVMNGKRWFMIKCKNRSTNELSKCVCVNLFRKHFRNTINDDF